MKNLSNLPPGVTDAEIERQQNPSLPVLHSNVRVKRFGWVHVDYIIDNKRFIGRDCNSNAHVFNLKCLY